MPNFPNRRFFLIAALILCNANAAPAGLTLDDAMNKALQSQPSLLTLEAAQRVSNELRQLNMQDPAVSPFEKTLQPLRDPQSALAQASIDLAAILLTDAQRRHDRELREKQSQQKSPQELQARVIRRAAGLAWLDLYYTQHAQVLVQAMQRDARDRLKLVESAHRNGKAAQGDVIKAQETLNREADRQLELKNQQAKASAELTRWLGIAVPPLAEKIVIAAPPPLAELRLRLGQHAQQQIHFQTRNIATAELNLVELQRNTAGSPAGQKSAPLVAALRALRDQAVYAERANLAQLEAALASAYADWQITLERRDLIEKSSAPNAERRLESVFASYRGGKADFNAVLDAQQQVQDSRWQQLRLQVELAGARVRLGFFE